MSPFCSKSFNHYLLAHGCPNSIISCGAHGFHSPVSVRLPSAMAHTAGFPQQWRTLRLFSTSLDFPALAPYPGLFSAVSLHPLEFLIQFSHTVATCPYLLRVTSPVCVWFLYVSDECVEHIHSDTDTHCVFAMILQMPSPGTRKDQEGLGRWLSLHTACMQYKHNDLGSIPSTCVKPG